MRYLNSLFLLVFSVDGFSQQIGARIEPVWAPILTEEIRSGKTVPEPPQYIYFDPERGTYLARYIPTSGDAKGFVSVPIRFRIETSLSAESSILRKASDLEYHWSFQNAQAAKYPSNLILLTLPRADQTVSCQSPVGLTPVRLQHAGPTAARQISESPAISRLSLGDWRFALLFPSEGGLAPGSQAAGWLCTSQFLPGWTTGYSGGGSDTVLPDAPIEVHEQLAKIRTFERYFQSFVTFGPKYPQEAPAVMIALDFLHGLTVMETMKQLQSSSPFLAAVRSHIERIVAEEEVRKIEGLKPSTRFEHELLTALSLSLPKYF